MKKAPLSFYTPDLKPIFRFPSHPIWRADPELCEPELSITQKSPSTFASSVSGEKEEEKVFSLISARAIDIRTVRNAYDHHPIVGYEIVSIDIIHNRLLENLFENNLGLLNTRANNPKYKPLWLENSCDQNLAFRQSIVGQYQNLSAPYRNRAYQHVHLLPMWHGTQDTVAHYIFEGNYGIFDLNDPNMVTDEGFFGRGIYSAYEAEYAFRCYAEKYGNEAVLIFNWVSFFAAYPVIDMDYYEGILRGKKGGYAQCDAHFVPVRSDKHPNTDVYIPCAIGQLQHYTELVVFERAQCLPRYRVKLRHFMMDMPLERLFGEKYQQALGALQNSQAYEQAQPLLENSAISGNAAAIIRLQWFYSGEAECIKLNQKSITITEEQLAQAVITLLPYTCPMGRNWAEAQFLLGWCYAKGVGVEQNNAIACEYFWLAAEQRHAEAQQALAKGCSTGLGVEKSWPQAIYFYQKAADNGLAQARYALAIIYEIGLGGINPNLALSIEYRQQLKEIGYFAFLHTPEAHYNRGLSCEKNHFYEEAAISYYKATEKGHIRARTNLGTFFMAGRGGCKKNEKQAYQFWKQSAEEGHQRAMLNLANQLKKGIGVEVDVAAAAEWERKARIVGGRI